MPLRLVPLVLSMVVALMAAACGNDAPTTEDAPVRTVEDFPAAEERDPAFAEGAPYSLTEVEGRLEAAGLRLVRTGVGPFTDPEHGFETLEAAREAVASTDREFTLLIFPSAAEARDSLPAVRESELFERNEGDVILTGQNVVAVLRGPPQDNPSYRVVEEVLGNLEPSPAQGTDGSPGP